MQTDVTKSCAGTLGWNGKSGGSASAFRLDMYDLELACLKETEASADVDIYLRVSAGADGEAALLLRGERVLRGQICLDGIGLLLRRID